MIVDDYSRYTWVFFFKTKVETQQTIIDFSNEAQRQHNVAILVIRSDNGSEFKNYTLNEFLSEEGIRHQYSAAYTPQQNGVAERKNRTLIEMARSMMAEFKSPNNFWAEAINTACHSSNRLFFRKGLMKTPYEVLTGNKPNITYFRVFGCKCFYLIKGARIGKFHTRSLEGTFVGYGAESHTYRVYDKASRIVIESCSVAFEENNGSLVEQVGVSDVGDVQPQDAILRMGVGFHRPVEVYYEGDQQGPSSTQVVATSSQGTQDNNTVPNMSNQEDGQEPSTAPGIPGEPENPVQPDVGNSGGLEFPVQGEPGISGSAEISGGSSQQGQDQPTPSSHEVTPRVDQDHQTGQGGDKNDQDDQVIPPTSRGEIEVRRVNRVGTSQELRALSLDKVLGDVRSKVSTRRQLASFSEHQAHISMVEPKKVFEALEDPDWLEAMHDELNNFRCNKVWLLVERPKD